MDSLSQRFSLPVRGPSRSGTASRCGREPAEPSFFRFGSQHVEEERRGRGEDFAISALLQGTPPGRHVLHREDLSGDESEHAHQGGGSPVQEVGDLLVQGNDALTGFGPVARVPPLASQLSLARTQLAPESVRWRGFSTRTVSPDSVASVARVSTPQSSPAPDGRGGASGCTRR